MVDPVVNSQEKLEDKKIDCFVVFMAFNLHLTDSPSLPAL